MPTQRTTRELAYLRIEAVATMLQQIGSNDALAGETLREAIDDLMQSHYDLVHEAYDHNA